MSQALEPNSIDPDNLVLHDRVVPTLGELFLAFLSMGMLGFGGVLPIARRAIIHKHKWLTAEEFTDLLGLCQFLPGGNIINLTVVIGLRFRGIPGALVTALGLLAAPSTVVIILGTLYERGSSPSVRHMIAGVAAAAAGLLIATSLEMAQPLKRQPIGLAVAVVFFIAIALLRLPMLPTIVVLGPVSVLIKWWTSR
jgi:chromate transporter